MSASLAMHTIPGHADKILEPNQGYNSPFYTWSLLLPIIRDGVEKEKRKKERGLASAEPPLTFTNPSDVYSIQNNNQIRSLLLF
jgi:hypothetical protein